MYSFQTFSIGQILTAAQMNQVEASIRDHVHGTAGVSEMNLTGHITSTGLATALGSFTSAQLLAALTDETGTGVAVFGTSPVFTTQISTPKIVTASGNLEITPAATIALMKATYVKSITNSVEAFGLEGIGSSNRAISFYTTSDWTGNIDIVKANVGVTTHLTGDGLSYLNGGDFRIGSTGSGKFVVYGSTSNVIAQFHNIANCNTAIVFNDADSTGMKIIYANASTGAPDKDLIFHNGTNETARLTAAGILSVGIVPLARMMRTEETKTGTAAISFTSIDVAVGDRILLTGSLSAGTTATSLYWDKASGTAAVSFGGNAALTQVGAGNELTCSGVCSVVTTSGTLVLRLTPAGTGTLNTYGHILVLRGL